MTLTLSRILSGKNMNDLFDSLIDVFEAGSFMRPCLCTVDTKSGVKIIKLTHSPFLEAEFYGVDMSDTMTDNESEAEILAIFNREVVSTGITPCIVVSEGHGQYTGVVKTLDELGVDCDRITRQKREGDIQGHLVGYAKTWLCNVKYEIDVKLSRDVVNMTALERCNITFYSVLLSYYDSPSEFVQMKSFLFMIIYTLYQLNRIYPGFMHNDLHVNNIMFKYDDGFRLDVQKMQTLKFHVDNTVYSTPYFGIIPKIIDFGLASVPSRGIVSRNVKYSMFAARSRFKNDLSRLLWDVWSHPNIQQSSRMVDLLYRLDPKQIYRNSEWAAMAKSEEMRPYGEIIASGIWSEYRNKDVSSDRVYAEYGKQ